MVEIGLLVAGAGTVRTVLVVVVTVVLDWGLGLESDWDLGMDLEVEVEGGLMRLEVRGEDEEAFGNILGSLAAGSQVAVWPEVEVKFGGALSAIEGVEDDIDDDVDWMFVPNLS